MQALLFLVLAVSSTLAGDATTPTPSQDFLSASESVPEQSNTQSRTASSSQNPNPPPPPPPPPQSDAMGRFVTSFLPRSNGLPPRLKDLELCTLALDPRVPVCSEAQFLPGFAAGRAAPQESGLAATSGAGAGSSFRDSDADYRRRRSSETAAKEGESDTAGERSGEGVPSASAAAQNEFLFRKSPCGEEENACTCCLLFTEDRRNLFGVADCSQLEARAVTSVPHLPNYINYLVISGSDFRAVNLTKEFFANASAVNHRTISHLYFQSNVVSLVQDDAFAKLSSLVCLNVRNSSGFNQALLAHTLNISTLTVLDAQAGGLSLPAADDFNLISSSVLQIDLSYSCSPAPGSFGTYDLAAFAKLPQLVYLTLSHCGGMREIVPTAVLGVKSLWLESNDLQHFPQTCDLLNQSFFPILESMSLKNNSIAFLSGPLCLPRLVYLDISENRIQNIPDGFFSSQSFPQLQHVDLRSQKPSLMKVGAHAFNNSALLTIDMSVSRGLNFSDDSSVRLTAFDGCWNLTSLLLEGTDFQGVGESRFAQLFSHLPSLKMLTLSNTHMHRVSAAMFNGLANVTVMALNQNELSAIPDGTFDSLRYLLFLDLSFNNIENITRRTFSRRILCKTLINLKGNPFYCSSTVDGLGSGLMQVSTSLSGDVSIAATSDDDRDEEQTCSPWHVREDVGENDTYCAQGRSTPSSGQGQQLSSYDQLRQTILLGVIGVSGALIGLALLVSAYRRRWQCRLLVAERIMRTKNIQRLNSEPDYDSTRL